MALVGSIYMCGVLFGSFIFGFLGDLLGRWWALILAILLTVTAGLGGAFVDHYEWYCVTRFFAGMGRMGTAMLY